MSKAKQALIVTLTERFPKAFPADHQAIRPLKIGIDQDIRTACPDLDEKVLRHVLGSHTRRLSYLKALARGGERIDLDGNPVEAITAEACAQAKERLNTRSNPPSQGESKGTAPKAQERPVKAPTKPHQPGQPKAQEKPITAPSKANQAVQPKAQQKSVTVQTKANQPAIKATVATRSGLPILSLKRKR